MATTAPTTRLPLFPLQRVLFPGVPLRMQIFEQRYLRLVRESLADGSPFGVVPIVNGREAGETPEIWHWGTLVAIRDWTQMPNGLLGVTVAGDQRLRVVSTSVDDDGLMIGRVVLLPAEDEQLVGEEDADLVGLLDFLARKFGVEEHYLGPAMSRSTLAWRLADLLPVVAAIKVGLLEADNPDERLAQVRTWVANLQRPKPPI
ncbi:MAG: LON peptidase substrate-binding domain-containing protein [Porticoccaceae bacterium]